MVGHLMKLLLFISLFFFANLFNINFEAYGIQEMLGNVNSSN